jgi:predicted NBD/HSP70 family sugar kinase
VYRGHHGAAGEPGHLIIDIDHHISLETAYQKLMQSNAALIAEEAYRGDILARQRFEEIGANLGVAFSTIVDLLDPEMIIIGGGVLAASDLFLDAAKENMKKYIFSQVWEKNQTNTKIFLNTLLLLMLIGTLVNIYLRLINQIF